MNIEREELRSYLNKITYSRHNLNESGEIDSHYVSLLNEKETRLICEVFNITIVPKNIEGSMIYISRDYYLTTEYNIEFLVDAGTCMDDSGENMTKLSYSDSIDKYVLSKFPYTELELEEIRIKKEEAYNKSVWGKINNRYNVKIISNNNNIVLIEIQGKMFYFTFKTKKIRAKGKNNWTGKVLSFLKEELEYEKSFEINYKRKEKKVYSSDDMAPGKYKDKTWLEVKDLDINYIEWMIGATKDMNLKEMLLELIKEKV